MDGLLLAPNAVVDDAAPKAGVELAPNREVPVAGAPKAGVLLAPNAAGALAPDPKGFDVAAAPKLKELPEDAPKGCRHRLMQQAHRQDQEVSKPAGSGAASSASDPGHVAALLTGPQAFIWEQSPLESSKVDGSKTYRIESHAAAPPSLSSTAAIAQEACAAVRPF
jgi:hypothetical protein